MLMETFLGLGDVSGRSIGLETVQKVGVRQDKLI